MNNNVYFNNQYENVSEWVVCDENEALVYAFTYIYSHHKWPIPEHFTQIDLNEIKFDLYILLFRTISLMMHASLLSLNARQLYNIDMYQVSYSTITYNTPTMNTIYYTTLRNRIQVVLDLKLSLALNSAIVSCKCPKFMDFSLQMFTQILYIILINIENKVTRTRQKKKKTHFPSNRYQVKDSNPWNCIE